MQGDFLAFHATGVELCQHLVGEVETRCGSRHAALDFGVDGLVGGEVALAGVAVQIRRDGQLSGGLYHIGERAASGPGEAHLLARVVLAHALGGERHLLVFHLQHPLQASLLPFLQVAHHAEPLAAVGGLEHPLIVGRQIGLEQEHLYQCAGGLAEEEAGAYHARIVEHHERPFGYILRQVAEHILAYLAVAVEEEFRGVAARQGKLGYPVVGEGIVVIAYLYFLWIHFHCFHVGCQSMRSAFSTA